jgi:glycosyltransferase involved in cell wall biosynthesis
MKILFLTCNGIKDASFGGAKCSIRNYEALKEHGDVEVLTIQKKSNMASFLSVLQGYFPPVGRNDLKTVAEMLDKEKYDLVFFDGSYFGNIVKYVKKRGVRAITFFHNCEQDYLEVRMGRGFSVKKMMYHASIVKQERMAAQNSDANIVLTGRDKGRIQTLYAAKNITIIPMTLPDIYQGEAGTAFEAKKPQDKVCLLFGPLGRANEEAFKWFVENVSPYLKCRTLVAGKGFDAYRQKWSSEKVSVTGFVNDVSQVYEATDCVAIPLLSGGGMKIKTAEAMMFGKYIYGTAEAFVGYDIDTDRAGALCATAKDFIDAINRQMDMDMPAFNSYTRERYLEKYSSEASREAFAQILINQSKGEA